MRSVLTTYTLVVAAALITASADVNAACLQYGPTTLTGTLVRQTYAGPPDYESTTRGDAPIAIVILQLDRSVCLTDGSGRLPTYATKEVQLELTQQQMTRYLRLLGNRVSIAGQLIEGGAKHDKRVVLAGPQLLK